MCNTPHSPTRAPHKHAELIKAWADGAEIQLRVTGFGGSMWKDDYPLWNPSFEYRIKPKTIKYRVALCIDYKGYKYTYSVNESDYRPSIETELHFVKWLGDWQEVEV